MTRTWERWEFRDCDNHEIQFAKVYYKEGTAATQSRVIPVVFYKTLINEILTSVKQLALYG